MPEVSRFYGIIIRMFYNDHAPPHFHAMYAEHSAVFSIKSLALLTGKLPSRAHGLVVEWASLHQDELLDDWHRGRNMEALPHHRTAALSRAMAPITVTGDLLTQPVEVIVNAWNRNLFPWWLLLPQGVSGAIKREAGLEPFRELRKIGLLPLGAAVLTSAGRLPYQGIIHVAGINLLWRSSEYSIRESVRNALALAAEHGFESIAFPLIGAGSGGGRPEVVERIMVEAIEAADYEGQVIMVRYARSHSNV